MNESIYLCYKRTLQSIIAASLVFEKLRNNGYKVCYTRKLRPNDYILHLDELLENVIDVIVLLDDSSFWALEEDGKQRFMKSWFSKELLKCSKLNIIVICLNGYKLPNKEIMPEEFHFLYDSQIKELDTYKINVSDNIEAYVGELKSKPELKFLIENRVSFEQSADFLLYSNGDCNIYEYGYLVATLDVNVDKHHPYKYTVNRSGQHCFYAINNDTGQTQELSFEISPGFQKYVPIQWEPSKVMITLKDDDIKKETDARLLYNWGKSFFFGNPKYKPDFDKSLSCFLRAAELGNQKAIDFIRRYDHSLSSIYKVPMDMAGRWYNCAAKYGSPEAWMKMGEIKELQGNFSEAISCYEKAMEFGHAEALSDIERCKQVEQKKTNTQQKKFLKDFHTIIQNFKRQKEIGRVGKHGRDVDFAYVVDKLEAIEKLFKDDQKKSVTSFFDSNSLHSKYYNRFYGLLGYLAQIDVFRNLSHKDILDICVDNKGDNQSDVNEFIHRMGGITNLNPANISKNADRIITGGIKNKLDNMMGKHK